MVRVGDGNGSRVAARALLDWTTHTGVIYVQRVTDRLHIVTLSVPREAPLFGRPAPSGRPRFDFDDHVVRKHIP